MSISAHCGIVKIREYCEALVDEWVSVFAGGAGGVRQVGHFPRCVGGVGKGNEGQGGHSDLPLVNPLFVDYSETIIGLREGQ